MRVQRGDVVLVDYPYSDRTGSKVRPCLVVQNDRNNQRLDDTIVVTITRTTLRAQPVARAPGPRPFSARSNNKPSQLARASLRKSR